MKRDKFKPDTLGHIPRRRHYQDLARLDDETRKRSGGPQCSAFLDEKPGPACKVTEAELDRKGRLRYGKIRIRDCWLANDVGASLGPCF